MTPAETYPHGLIVGKFYPPHAGHHYLIDEAGRRCRNLTVVVAGSREESLPLDLRAEWIRERHSRARVVAGYDETRMDLDDPAIWDAHIRVFRELCPEPVDAVFSSEAYGDELARRFKAVHVPIDPGRRTVAVSGTAVRADPIRQWEHLDGPVRAWLTRRIAIVGAESTGTTTLARALAELYKTAWVPEYGRALTEELVASGTSIEAIDWRTIDFAEIAHRQLAAEDDAARRAGPLLICDTEATATCVWRERYVGASTAALDELALARKYALYILTSDDIDFHQDGLRDGEHLRSWMTQRFRERLATRPERWVEVSGSHRSRLTGATAAIEAVLAEGWLFQSLGDIGAVTAH